MHRSGTLGRALREECSDYGWTTVCPSVVDWQRLCQTIQNYIKRLNFGYRNSLRAANVEVSSTASIVWDMFQPFQYINASASFLSPTRIRYFHKEEEKVIEASRIAIAVGGRPSIPTIEGSQFCITSDDIFSLTHPPGHTLVVGGSYVALETAGFLNDLGVSHSNIWTRLFSLFLQFPVKLCLRSIPLRGFDRQCAEMVLDHLIAAGVEVVNDEPSAIIKQEDGLLLARLKNQSEISNLNTVIMCVGRKPELSSLNLEALPHGGPRRTAKGFLDVNEFEETSLESVYALGDVIGRAELTPVAIKAGELLARRLFGDSKQWMDYSNVPTTVFTPIEYGCVGVSQERAEEVHGKENIEIYVQEFDPIELSCVERPSHENVKMKDSGRLTCLAKLICLKDSSKLRIIGVHFVGPDAGEVIQGLALSVTLRADKSDLDRLVGIHPTNAEVFTQMETTLRSGLPYRVSGGCGGGKCG
ncbi:thioredoxin reductase-like [Condylostylus longicornis]|uniref:thioredoxin reductase-like n=1 Tax=Condylostylus longicornis TaxID=2530218 RepID=UPI00244E0824|nr:thioredoxin reductase-like [Condylostylus longicornis]